MKSQLVSSLLLGLFCPSAPFSTLPNVKRWNHHASVSSARWKGILYSSSHDSTGRLKTPRVGEPKMEDTDPFLSTLHPKLPGVTTATTQDSFKNFLSPLLCALMLLIASPLPSNAGFGSGGASVSSFPEIKPLSTEEFLRLSPQKQRQREFSVSCFSNGDRYCETGAVRLYESIKQFNSENEESLTEELKGLEQRALKESVRLDDEYQLRLTLEESLKQQTQLLDALGKQPAYISYGAAAIGSIISTLIMHPIDTIKVQLMNSKGDDDTEDTKDDSGGDDDEAEEETKEKSKSKSSAPSPQIDFANVYKGILANIMKEAPSSALYLGIYELIRTSLSGTIVGQEPLVVYLIAGSIGEFFGSLMRAPAEAVKTRLQLGSGDGMTTLEAAEQVFFNEAGRTNLFTSWRASLWRDIPMGAIQLAIFESVKTFVISSPDIELDVSTLTSEALFGALGGSVGAFVTTPADVITTICINSLSDENLQLYRNKNPLEVLQLLHAEGGMAALFTGWRERVIYWAPAIGIFLSIYCGTRQMALSVLG